MTAPKTIALRRGWTPVPRGIVGKNGNPGKWPKSWAQHRLLEVIAEAIKFDGEATISNIDLMRMASLDKDSLPKARTGLVKLGWITATPIDSKRRRYKYTIVESAGNEETKDTTHEHVSDETDTLYLIPREEFFARLDTTPNLEGRKPTRTTDAPVKSTPVVPAEPVDDFPPMTKPTQTTQRPPQYISREERRAAYLEAKTAKEALAATQADKVKAAMPNFPSPPPSRQLRMRMQPQLQSQPQHDPVTDGVSWEGRID